MRIGVLAYEGCLAAEIFVFTDLLRIANRVARETGAATEDPFRVSVIAASAEPVAASGGFPVGVTRWHHRFDRLIVPGFELVPSEDVAARLGSLQRETRFLRAAAERGTRIASVCVGAFLLGEAGLLDGRRATTSWLFASRLARRYPRTTVCPEALIVTDGRSRRRPPSVPRWTLATALVREHLGDDVARRHGADHAGGREPDESGPVRRRPMLPSARGPFATRWRRGSWRTWPNPTTWALADAFHVEHPDAAAALSEPSGALPARLPPPGPGAGGAEPARNHGSAAGPCRRTRRVPGCRDVPAFVRRAGGDESGRLPPEVPWRRKLRGDVAAMGGDVASPRRAGTRTD